MQSQKEQRWAELTDAIFACAVPLASRPAVAQVPVPSLAVGLVGSTGRVVRVPESAKGVVRMAAALLQEEWPQAIFTTLQINRGFGAQPHVDAYNVGLSYTCSVGDFERGGLWLANPFGCTKVRMPQLGASLSHLSGCVLRGRVTDTRCA